MKGHVHLSINQLADFANATESKKKNIINQQKTPNPFKISYYQLAKARIKKSMATKGDLEPVLKGIEELKNRTVTKKRQVSDKVVSLDAMQRFVSMKIPNLLKDYNYKIIKDVYSKSTLFNGVEIIVSPDLIIEIDINGKKFYGGIKIHIAKGNKFDTKQQAYVATAIKKYLQETISQNEENVLSELCMSIDIFGHGIISAPEEISSKIKDMEILCEEVKRLWYA